jgi:uncharacterized protein with NRDE domain
MLALRDERVSRAFDPPEAWWPGHPGVVGGRDRQAGGSWCVSDIARGATAVLLNRSERPVASLGAPSRGLLPLAAIKHGTHWTDEVDLGGMASFNLMLVEADSLTWWRFDGQRLDYCALAPGVHVITPAGLSAEPSDRRLLSATARLDDDLSRPTEQAWADWLLVLRSSVPSAEPGALLVRRPLPADDWFQTVFGQFIAARPGTLRVDYVKDPAANGAWTTRFWSSDPAPVT